MKFRHGVFTLATAMALHLAAWADGLDEDRIKELVLETIRENPGIVMEAVAILEQRQADAAEVARADVLSNQRALLEQDTNAPILGNPDGDVTVVEFFDYNCPYCRRAMDEVQGLWMPMQMCVWCIANGLSLEKDLFSPPKPRWLRVNRASMKNSTGR